MNLYVSNISPAVQAADLQQIFAGTGQVLFAQLADGDGAGGCAGFAFVNIPNDDNARRALAKLNGQDLKGGKLTVCPMPERLGVVGGARK